MHCFTLTYAPAPSNGMCSTVLPLTFKQACRHYNSHTAEKLLARVFQCERCPRLLESYTICKVGNAHTRPPCLFCVLCICCLDEVLLSFCAARAEGMLACIECVG